MLIQLPQKNSGQAKSSPDAECNAFEAALRRDLSSAPVISYDSVLGGVGKRALDVVLTLVSAPPFFSPRSESAMAAGRSHATTSAWRRPPR
jgi:hypothetical protein